MKKIIRIARIELSNLFYSPIAWLLLIIFVVQSALCLTENIQRSLEMQQMQKLLFSIPPGSATFSILVDQRIGLLPLMANKLYLYIPLLTMGLISREVSTGSIRLLYSSPVKIFQIVLGKYFAMMVYNLLLILILAIFGLAAISYIPHADNGLLFSGLLAVGLLLSAYAAIGLFMSCLTSYQVVAAISTLAVFAALQYIGQIWQDVDFVRDLTYFLSLGSRTQDMFRGMITSRDILYFIIITALFLGFSGLRLKADQEYLPKLIKGARYAGLLAVAVAIGYVTSAPATTAYFDVTSRKMNTLTPSTQKLLQSANKSPLEMTAYVNLMDSRYGYGAPEARNSYLKTWERYVRFKPIDFNFYYYYDTTASSSRQFERHYKGKTLEEVAKQYASTNHADFTSFHRPEDARKIAGLANESGHMVMRLEYNGNSTFLRMYDDLEVWPSEAQFATALKRLMMPLSIQRVGVLTGHLERSADKSGDRSYSSFLTAKSNRFALVNNGFDVLTIQDGEEIPDNLAILVIADPKKTFSKEMLGRVFKYIDDGGNLLITTEPGKQTVIEPLLKQLGITLRSGVLVAPNKDEAPDFVESTLTPAAENMSMRLASMQAEKQLVLLQSAAVLDYKEDTYAFKAEPLLTNEGKDSWLRKGNLVNDSSIVEFNKQDGDETGIFAMVMKLHRRINGREQRIIVSGDADFMGNQAIKLRHRTNIPFSTALFKWLSGGLFPIEQSRTEPQDQDVVLSERQLAILKLFLLWILPGILLLCGTVLLLRRKRK